MGTDALLINDISTYELLSSDSDSEIFRIGESGDNGSIYIAKCVKSQSQNLTPNSLQREYKTSVCLEHDNIAKCLWMQKINGRDTIIYEGSNLISLDRYLFSTELTIDATLDICIQLVKAVAYIHRKQIIHYNINSESILINAETLEIKLINFLYCIVNKDDISANTKHVNEKMCSFMSPEQTGRMAINIDCRSDLYSIGAILYFLLTRKYLYNEKTFLNYSHRHMTSTPEDASTFRSDVPVMIINIVNKLLKKNISLRYQTALGVLYDLLECKKVIHNNTEIKRIALGEKDHLCKFSFPESLYGRELEKKQLTEVLDSAISGSNEVVLVSGPPGSGKTALVSSVIENIPDSNISFISRKFDRLNVNIAYVGVISLVKQFLEQVMLSDDNIISEWKELMVSSLYPNIKVLTDLVPEFEILVGKQPEIQVLGPIERQNRFNFVMRNFFRAMSKKNDLTIIFFDDIQWADLESLSLIKSLISTNGIENFVVIATYRNNEVKHDHPVKIILEELKDDGRTLIEIALRSLTVDSTREFVVDLLQEYKGNVGELANIVCRKTGGSPLFIRTFLKAVHDRGMLSIDEDFKWFWNVDAIRKMCVTDNIVDFLLKKLNSLPEDLQKPLQILSCLSNACAISNLSNLCQLEKNETEKRIIKVVDLGLVNYFNETIVFSHDKIKEAVYLSMGEKERTEQHLYIGKNLLMSFNKKNEEELFLIAEQLNPTIKSNVLSYGLLLKLVEINFKAAKKIKSLTAYQSAYEYLSIAISLSANHLWQDNYSLAFNLYKEYVDCAYLSKHFKEAELAFKKISENVKTDQELAEILCMKVSHKIIIGKMRESISLGKGALRLLGINLHELPSWFDIFKERISIKRKLKCKKIQELAGLPAMKNEKMHLALKILMELTLPAINTNNEKLVAMVIMKQIALTLRYGSTPESAYAYVAYGVILCSFFQEFDLGYQFGELAMVCSKNDIKWRSRVIYTFAASIYGWKGHWMNLTKYFDEAIQAGYQSGDLVYIGYSCYAACAWDPISDLNDLFEKLKKYVEIAKSSGYAISYGRAKFEQQYNSCLLGRTNGRLSFSDNEFNEEEYFLLMQKEKYIFGIASYYLLQLKIRCIYGCYNEAFNLVEKINPIKMVFIGRPYEIEFSFYSFLTYTAKYNEQSYFQKKRFRKKMYNELRKIKNWFKYCPTNAAHFYYIMLAEYSRIQGKPNKALLFFNKALYHARKNEHLRYLPLINEIVANLYIHLNNRCLAKPFINEADRLYQYLGYYEKAKQVQAKYNSLMEFDDKLISNVRTLDINQRHSQVFPPNIMTIIEASQAISREVNIDKLLTRLLKIILVNAGAQRGLLLVNESDVLQVKAEGKIVDRNISVNIYDSSINHNLNCMLLLPVINFVKNTKNIVVYHNVSQEKKFKNHSYVIKNTPVSLLCLPIVKQEKLLAILYLENNIIADAFSDEKLLIAKLLSGQAAISLENALFYADKCVAEEKNQQHQLELAHYSRLSIAGEMISTISHEVNQPLTSIVQYLGGCIERLKKTNTPIEIIDVLNLVIKQAEHAGGVIHKLKDFLRKDKLKKVKINIVSIIHDALDIISSRINKDNVNVSLDANNVNDNDLMIDVDIIQIQQVILNILTNSLDAMSKLCCTDKSIWISVSVDNSYVSIVFTDTGPGIKKEVRNSIFKAFVTTKKQGMGLGLSISKSIAEDNMGDLICLPAKSGVGARFCLKLPITNKL